MFELIRFEDTIESPWKNGLGKTRQMAIHPADASLSAMDFDWRLSSAVLLSDNDFSLFPGFDRILFFKARVKLNGEIILPHFPYAFPGEEAIHCTLLDSPPILDIGLIIKRGKHKAIGASFTITESKQFSMNSQNRHFFYSTGPICLNDYTMSAGDVLMAVEESNLNIRIVNPTVLYHFELL